jgi:hypothetical protein
VGFKFAFPDPYEFTIPPSADGGIIVGFDVGSYGMTKHSTRMLCIPPEEGYGAAARVGIPANSTIVLEIKCKEIDLPPPAPKGLPCNPHAKPVEHCPGDKPCPPTGECPTPPAPPAPPAPPVPPAPPPTPTPGSKCANSSGLSSSLAAGDCQAWVDIFDATGGRKWTACSGNRLDPCSCHGPVDPATGLHRAEIVCETTAALGGTRITSLDLGPNNLTGSIPASIGSLTKLTEFGIFVNPGLAGSRIPSSIGLLTGVARAHLYLNGLAGTIPPSIGGMVDLETLMLNDNHLTGSIPSTLSKLTRLTDLELHHNRLSGRVPPLGFESMSEQCSLDAVGAPHRLPADPATTGPCTPPNCNKVRVQTAIFLGSTVVL